MTRKSTFKGLVTLCAAAVLFTAPTLSAAERKVVQVEETWEMAMGDPDPMTCSPQIGTQMHPDAGNLSNFAIFCINYQEIPDFSEGGLEIQLWEGEWNTDVTVSESVKLTVPYEVITWTQVMKIHEGKLEFAVTNGNSSTFGSFGGTGFKVISQSEFNDLSGYNVENSVNNSGITLGSNRVDSMTIVSVKKVYSDGTEEIDSTPKLVFEGE